MTQIKLNLENFKTSSSLSWQKKFLLIKTLPPACDDSSPTQYCLYSQVYTPNTPQNFKYRSMKLFYNKRKQLNITS